MVQCQRGYAGQGSFLALFSFVAAIRMFRKGLAADKFL